MPFFFFITFPFPPLSPAHIEAIINVIYTIEQSSVDLLCLLHKQSH